MIPTAEELDYYVRPFSEDSLTLQGEGTQLIATRCLTVDATTGKASEMDGYSNAKHTKAIANKSYIHVYMPCTDRVSADVLHAMIRHTAEG